MDILAPLFEGQSINLTPIDHEKDPEIESGWTLNSQFMRLLSTQPMRPLSPFQVKKKYEAIEKEMEESKNMFYFAIRTHPTAEQPEEELIGFAQLKWIGWNNGTGEVVLGLGDPANWGKGYGSEALRLLLRYAFSELNLSRLSAVMPEYHQAARKLFERAGFIEEVRRRQAIQRDGQRWDLLHLGLLREEWESLHNG